MSEPAAVCEIRPDDKVRVRRHPEWGTGEVLRVSRTLGVHQARVLFEAPIAENPLPERSAVDFTETAR